MAVLTYRSVKGSRLTAAEFDGNTHNLDDRLVVLEGADTEVEIEFSVAGNQLFATVNGGAEQGPFDLPTIQWNFREDGWLPATVYAANDVFVEDFVIYRVISSHTSEAVFDPGSNTAGSDFYEVLIDLNFGAVAGVSQFLETSDDEITAGLSFANKFVECTDPATLVTIPTNASAAHALNTEIHFCQVNAGNMLFEAAVGVTIDYPTGFALETEIAGAVVTFKKLETNRWRAFGLLAVSTA